MKKMWFMALLVLVVPVQAAFASTIVRSGDSVTVAENQTVEGNFYALGGAVALSGTIAGDAALIGGNVTVNGTVTDDLFVLGGTVNLNASGTQDVRIIAGDVTISEPILGSLVVLGGRLTVLSTASIGGDLLFYGEDATIDGPVGGQILGNVRNLRVNGAVGKGIDVTSRYLTLGDRASVTGDVEYKSQAELVRSPNAVVEGKVMQGSADTTPAQDIKASLRQLAIVFLMSLFATLSLYLMARRFTESVAQAGLTKLGLKSLIGFALLALAPAAIAILLVSTLGALVGVVLLALVLAMVFIALALMNAVCGAVVAKLVTKRTQVTVPYIILGAIILHVSIIVPFVGPVVLTLVFLTTLGTLAVQLYQFVTTRS